MLVMERLRVLIEEMKSTALGSVPLADPVAVISGGSKADDIYGYPVFPKFHSKREFYTKGLWMPPESTRVLGA